MKNQKKKEVLKTLEQYLPIKYDIQDFSVAKAPEYLAKLLRDDEELKVFLCNPRQALQHEGVDPQEIDVDLFKALALYLRGRKEKGDDGSQFAIEVGPKKEGINQQEVKLPEHDQARHALGASVNKKEKEQQNQWDFEHGSWLWRNVDSDAISIRGREATKVKGELVMKDKGFEVKGVGINPIDLLNPELRALFYPTQPLVTPELIRKIREILDKAE
jgi:hypothetical protein